MQCRPHPQPQLMNKLILFAAAALAGGILPAAAQGRTVVVLRSRPVAINPAPRPYICCPRPIVTPYTYAAPPAANYGYGYGEFYGRNYGGWLRVPAIYGHIQPRLHYVNPCVPNGYVGGLRNLPSNVVQIPHQFGRAPAARPAPPAPAPHGGGK
jgi:hypothetical protein